MPFNPKALNERTLKQFVDRLMQAHKDKPLPTAEQWPPKRSQIQEQIAAVLGFPSWHQAIHAVSGNNTMEEVIATPHGQPHYPFEPFKKS